MRLVGAMSQPVRATATVNVAPANGTRCMKPFMLPDQWNDANGNERYDAGDTYATPGYTRADIGTRLTMARRPNPNNPFAPSDYNAVGDIGEPPSATVTNQHIVNCDMTGWLGKPMSDVTGGNVGQIRSGIQELISRDEDATWNGTTVTGPYGLLSPRVVVIGLYDPAEYEADRQQGNGDVYHIVNLIAVFIESVTQQATIQAVIVGTAGDIIQGQPNPPGGAAFLHTIEINR
jgi:hypothetical protein